MRIKTASIPAPTGGWNARDSIGDMAANDAVILENWIPSTNYCELRKGYAAWKGGTTPLAAQVETLAAYASPTAAKLFAIAGTSLYEVTTSAGTWPAASVTGLGDARWGHTNFATSAGSYLYITRYAGGTTPYLFDGTTWTSITGASTPAITGVTTTSLVNVWQFKKRLFFVELNSTRVWYLPVDSIGGAANSLDLGGILRLGGKIIAGATWTLDAGYGLDDHCVIVSDKGEVVVFGGTDPGSATAWQLIGVYQIGAPLGNRCLTKAAGDLIVMCIDGFFPMTAALQSTRLTNNGAISDKIQAAVALAAESYRTNFGWDCLLYPLGALLIFNIPVQEGANQEQYCMSLQTRSWCKFTGMQANCWELFNDQAYFGGNGVVYQGLTGTVDNANTAATANIRADAQPAFNYFGNRGQTKRFTLARPVFVSDPPFGATAVTFDMNIDYDSTPPTSSPTYTGASGSVWDSGTWDTATWSGATVIKDWQSVVGVGFCATLRIQVAMRNTNLKWVSTDFVMELGGIL